jgi:hypothetical protein
MAPAALESFALSQQSVFCPLPLHIQKKPRRAAFRNRIFRKSTHHQVDGKYVYGPLDDIINEIRSDIWESPHDYSNEASHLGWAAPLEVPSSWTVTPLPVSRLPSSRPLTIRKNRETSSSTSSSSMGDHTNFSRTGSRDNAFNGGPVGAPASTGTTPWPSFDAPVSYETAHVPDASGNAGQTCQIENTENLSQNADAMCRPNDALLSSDCSPACLVCGERILER